MFRLNKKKLEEKKTKNDTILLSNKIECLLNEISEDDYEYDDYKKLVEIMKNWYILRYPDEYINYFFGKREKYSINDEVFWGTKKPDMDFFDILNAKVFFNTLNPRYKRYLGKVRYLSSLSIRVDCIHECLLLSKKGTITASSMLWNYEGKNIKELYNDIINGKVTVDDIKYCEDNKLKQTFLWKLRNTLEEAIDVYDAGVNNKNKVFDCVIYSLMNYWNLEIGAKRALLFAEEFKRDINVPLVYAATNSDKEFINYYLMLGGDINIECYKDYIRKDYNKIPLKDIMNKYSISNYEKEMFKRIITLIKNSLPKDIEKNEIKQKRIERKLNKSKI